MNYRVLVNGGAFVAWFSEQSVAMQYGQIYLDQGATEVQQKIADQWQTIAVFTKPGQSLAATQH